MEQCPTEKAPLSGGSEDVEVNITGCVNSGKAVEDASEDLTECSSSFGDTGSGIETGSAISDTEVESQMCADNASSSMCNDWSEQHRIRKKKTTTHWRRFIGPIMWRCKWIELQLKKLHSQELKYDKELAAYNYKKQLEFSKFTMDGFDVKSVPISNGFHKNKVMKRKKRKRAEEFDVSSYMSSHNLFSYYENKDFADDACLEDFPGVATRGNADNNEDFGYNVGFSVYHEDNEDNDKSLDDIIQKIEAAQSHVQKLKTRIDKVVSENPGIRSAMIGPSDGFNHSDLNSASFIGNENKFPVSFVHGSSQLKSELCGEDILEPGNTLCTHEGITPHIETINRPKLEIKDEVLTQNWSAKEELHDLGNVGDQLVEEAEEPVEEQKPSSVIRASEPGLVNKNALHNASPTLKACSTSKPNFPGRGARRRRRRR
ncbi:hypothetical protein RIF29_29867 [Crotalaria pallida]|uniref:Uncharacterized protein n=1 Tax=Crotalaria pallida TaxID=3830 RepID=A0AAN9I0T0_CROPI